MNEANMSAIPNYLQLQSMRTGPYLTGLKIKEMQEDSARFDIVNFDWKNADVGLSDLTIISLIY